MRSRNDTFRSMRPTAFLTYARSPSASLASSRHISSVIVASGFLIMNDLRDVVIAPRPTRKACADGKFRGCGGSARASREGEFTTLPRALRDRLASVPVTTFGSRIYPA